MSSSIKSACFLEQQMCLLAGNDHGHTLRSFLDGVTSKLCNGLQKPVAGVNTLLRDGQLLTFRPAGPQLPALLPPRNQLEEVGGSHFRGRCFIDVRAYEIPPRLANASFFGQEFETVMLTGRWGSKLHLQKISPELLKA